MKRHIIVLYILIAGLAGFVLFKEQTRPRHVYVDNTKLFAGFSMKKELEKKYQSVESERKRILDSLIQVIGAAQASSAASPELLDRLKTEYMYKKNTFEQSNSETMAQYNGQIWNQLNDYVKQYGKEKNYQYIFGANGQGSLMYAADAENITDELIVYVNQKYSGQ
jgi:outer membrane protein